MKKLLIALVFSLLTLTPCFAQQGTHSRRFTIAGPDSAINLTNTAIAWHQISWNVTGTASVCTVALDTSSNGTTWSAGGAITGQTCTTTGSSSVVNVSANYVRINMTALTLSTGGSVTVTWDGWVSNPASGGGGTLTSVVSTLPIVVTPDPITSTGAISCPTCVTTLVTPGSPVNSVQFNNAGGFGGSSLFTFNPATPQVDINNTSTTSSLGNFSIRGIGQGSFAGGTVMQSISTENNNPYHLVYLNKAAPAGAYAASFFSSSAIFNLNISDGGVNFGSFQASPTANGSGVISSGTANMFDFIAASDGTSPGNYSLGGNTTPFPVVSNTVNLMGPSTATFTGYALQYPSTGPTTATPLLSCITPVSSVSACSFVAPPTGTIGGSIAAGQVAVGSGANTIVGSSLLTWSNGISLLGITAPGGGANPDLIFTSFVGPNVTIGTDNTGVFDILGSTGYSAVFTAGGLNLTSASSSGTGVVLGLNGSTGTATLGAATAAGTPNRVNLPIATGAVGTFLRTDGGNPQQTSWVAQNITATNCSSSASPAVCVSATAGTVALPTNAVSSSVQVNTTAVTANSEIFVQSDDTLGTKLGVTCNSTIATLVGGLTISARVAGASFTIANNVAIITNPLCVSYHIIN